MTLELTTTDVPQEDDLATIRKVIQAIADGLADTQGLADKTGVSRRHVGYSINAAISLLLVDENLQVTEGGKKLLAAAAGTPEEKGAWRAAIEASPALKELAPNLLAQAEPDRKQLSEHIAQVSGLAPATAMRRVQALLSWRRQLSPLRDEVAR